MSFLFPGPSLLSLPPFFFFFLLSGLFSFISSLFFLLSPILPDCCNSPTSEGLGQPGTVPCPKPQGNHAAWQPESLVCANGVGEAGLSARSKVQEGEGHLHEDSVPTLRTLNVPMSLSLSRGGVWRKEAGGVLLMPPAPELVGDPQETAGPQILSQLCRINGDNS